MSHVLNVPAEQFETAVLAESRRRPVVVDFWAAWCGPCRALGPILERLAEEAGGRFLLAKVDVDRAQELAGAYQVQGIPAVKAFVDGQVVDEFTGALPEREVRRWLDGIVPGPWDEAAAEGERALAAGKPAEARAAFERALTLRPTHARSLLALARLDADEGRPDDALARLHSLSQEDRARREPELAALMLKLNAARAGGLTEVERRAQANPDDLDAQIALGRVLAAHGRHREALEALLGVVRKARRTDPGEEARKAMLEVFEAAGSRSELSDEYRSRLAAELYR